MELRTISRATIGYTTLVLIHPNETEPYYGADSKDTRVHTAPISASTQFFSGFGLCGSSQTFTFDDKGLGTTLCTQSAAAKVINSGRPSQVLVTVGADGTVSKVQEMFHP
ncbi:MAG: hypothetical protein M3Z00_10895 [Actinomycetota bacterium]|nr:hypothetical protein [Actinomycetota bacterium]